MAKLYSRAFSILMIVAVVVAFMACPLFVTSVAADGPPHLEVDKSVSPDEIWLEGLGKTPEKATVTLTVTGAGEAVSVPVDVMLIIDRSGTMIDPPAKLADAKTAAKAFIDLLSDTSDKSGLASFGTLGTLDQGLTFTKADVKNAIDALSTTLPERTNLGDGIDEANTELINHGRSSPVAWVEILLSDGMANEPLPTEAESIAYALGKADAAAAAGITIYTIGLGADVDTATMQEIASKTGGEYYFAPTSADLEAIYTEIGGVINGGAGTNVVVTDVLPDYINYEDAATKPPTSVTEIPDGTTTLVWNVGDLDIGESWTVSFDISSSQAGEVRVDVYPDSKVTYTNYEGNAAEAVFPETKITVLAQQFGTLEIFKFNDLNEDGVWDTGEPELGGWHFTVTGTDSFSDNTDSNGLISRSVRVGHYTVTETPKSGWNNTTPLTQATDIACEGTERLEFGNARVEVPPPAVPTLTHWGMIILAILFVAVFTISVRKRGLAGKE